MEKRDGSTPVSREEAEAEIARYKERLSHSSIRGRHAAGPCYTGQFVGVFRQRIKEYKQDLRRLRKEGK